MTNNSLKQNFQIFKLNDKMKDEKHSYAFFFRFKQQDSPSVFGIPFLNNDFNENGFEYEKEKIIFNLFNENFRNYYVHQNYYIQVFASKKEIKKISKELTKNSFEIVDNIFAPFESIRIIKPQGYSKSSSYFQLHVRLLDNSYLDFLKFFLEANDFYFIKDDVVNCDCVQNTFLFESKNDFISFEEHSSFFSRFFIKQI